MTVPIQKPAWYHQIRWRLTLSYSLLVYLGLVMAQFVYLGATKIFHYYYMNAEFESVRMLYVELQEVLWDDLLALPFILMIGHSVSRRFSQRLEDLVTTVGAWANGRFDVTIQDDSADEVGILSRQLQVMAGKLERTVETEKALAAARERDRFARDLHDTVKQQVFAMQMELSAVRNLVDSDPAAAVKLLDEAIGHSRQAQRDLTSLIEQVSPAGLDHKTLGVAVSEYVERMDPMGVEVEVRVTGDRDLPVELEEAFFRVAQGALSNVVRHSHAKTAVVEVEQDKERVLLRVTDTGVGFDMAEPRMKEFGLESLRTRMAEIGGTLVIDSQSDIGTVVTAQAPIPPR